MGSRQQEVGGEKQKRLGRDIQMGVIDKHVQFQGRYFIRPYWRCYFPNPQAIIYVVDSSDTDRLVIAKEEFHAILEDLPGALEDAAVTKALELHKIKNRQWYIFKTSAVKGEGLFEGLDW
ncbi:Small GTPase superfamily, ARF/SAR type [Corchorus olitorius]|uniref:Small GTPase superfamily, ARF/SAR type n=1 Tax=Corchorus olitorius TaxID=93759 RepID=A0A1R3J4W9_9ROSI|nr:Small GTPase superfamily, ARF/SAR type [Corchorus olitorius]